MKLPWPEIPSSHQPEVTVRAVLDYVIWISEELRRPGFYAAGEHERWRRRIHDAYRALFLPPVAGHGDPYPPDVPPARHAGTWPDVPAATTPGMTVRHQLKVIQLLAEELRDRIWVHGREPEYAEWDRRLTRARTALDHGDGHPMPEEAHTAASAEVLAEAQAQEDAKRDLIRRRERRLKRLKARAERRRAAGKTARAAASKPAVGPARGSNPTAKPAAKTPAKKAGPTVAKKKTASPPARPRPKPPKVPPKVPPKKASKKATGKGATTPRPAAKATSARRGPAAKSAGASGRGPKKAAVKKKVPAARAGGAGHRTSGARKK